ncbi:uncharacterized protein EI97DRAFT_434468 [Westerdykella ornata]|uniref:Uncharacterized protein n=1 Tax=Westerdykella ornata TaxID=318751 RepID=A0A6A6JFB3_WESOR|nr:uncharacterized protein EI97DRAFT_434468 [Westerdykella ornata]KAF2275241.1 hypothetical protein EI97DRAFT_434468 [Westerdykella ornata]
MDAFYNAFSQRQIFSFSPLTSNFTFTFELPTLHLNPFRETLRNPTFTTQLPRRSNYAMRSGYHPSSNRSAYTHADRSAISDPLPNTFFPTDPDTMSEGWHDTSFTNPSAMYNPIFDFSDYQPSTFYSSHPHHHHPPNQFPLHNDHMSNSFTNDSTATDEFGLPLPSAFSDSPRNRALRTVSDIFLSTFHEFGLDIPGFEYRAESVRERRAYHRDARQEFSSRPTRSGRRVREFEDGEGEARPRKRMRMGNENENGYWGTYDASSRMSRREVVLPDGEWEEPEDKGERNESDQSARAQRTNGDDWGVFDMDDPEDVRREREWDRANGIVRVKREKYRGDGTAEYPFEV